MRERLPVILVNFAAAFIAYSPCGAGEDGMTRLSNVSLTFRQKVAQQHILLWRWMALQSHLLRAFSDAFVIPNPTDRTPVIAVEAFPTPATSTITNHNARTTKMSTIRQQLTMSDDKRRHE